MSDEIGYRFIEDGDFIVFEDGRTFKKLDPQVSSGGYKFVRVGKKSYPLHRVIASVFIPNPGNKPEVNHIDCNKTNNAVSNLEWVTRKENACHAGEHGRFKKNTKNSKGRCDGAESKIRLCRKRAGVSQTRLAEALGVTQAAIAQWESGETQPTLDNLRKTADILGVTPGDLL